MVTSNLSYVPAGRSTVTTRSVPPPRGNDTSTGPVSNSSQSPLPSMLSQAGASMRFSSIFRNTISTLRMMMVSFPSATTVLSPTSATDDDVTEPTPATAALSGRPGAGRVENARPARALPLSEHATDPTRAAPARAAASSFACIQPPKSDVNGGGRTVAPPTLGMASGAPWDRLAQRAGRLGFTRSTVGRAVDYTKPTCSETRQAEE